MKKTWIYLLLLLAMVLPACKKILDIDRGTDTNPTPVTVEDFEQILNTKGICETPFYLTDEVTDDTYRPIYNNSSQGFYDWVLFPFGGTNDEEIYRLCYKWIAQMNLVIGGMATALPVGQMNDRRAVAIAQAKINRAYFYLQLVNIYGKHYEPASAGTDLGVPLVLKVNNQVSFPRATVEQVYQQILTDIAEALAIPELPNTDQKNINYPGRVAALALLARTYLYMGNYVQAEKAASDVLAIKRSLLNYRTYRAPRSADGRPITLVDQKRNVEMLLPRVFSADVPLKTEIDLLVQFPSDELRALFDRTNDKRYVASFIATLPNTPAEPYSFGRVGNNYSYNYGIGVPEMILIKAECLARANDAAGAVNLLNELRTTRILNYTNLSTSVSADVALTWVLTERRREFMFKGLRLFDLKRLNLDPRFKKDIERKRADGTLWVTLPAGSPNYVFPFSRVNLNGNPFLVQNPRVELAYNIN